MKLVILGFLEDDAHHVHTLLEEHDVIAYSELPVEGHGAGSGGWYGVAAPYRSRMIVAFLSAPKASELVDAIEACVGCEDSRHPVRAWMVDVERAVVPSAALSRAAIPNPEEELQP